MSESKASKDFIDRAERLLRWAYASLKEMMAHGRTGQPDDFERTFYNVLVQLTSLHEAISSAAKVHGLRDWRTSFNALRKDEPLLLYFWAARDSDVHDAIVKWESGTSFMQIKTVDQKSFNKIGKQFYQTGTLDEKMTRVFQYIYNVSSMDELIKCVRRREVPSSERQFAAGVAFEYAMESITLKSFSYRQNKIKITIPEPTNHFGKTGSSSAHVTTEKVIAFYAKKLSELKLLILQEK